MLDPPAVDRLAGIVDPEIKRRLGLVSMLTEVSNEIYKRTRDHQDRAFNDCFIATATSKASLKAITDAIDLYGDEDVARLDVAVDVPDGEVGAD